MVTMKMRALLVVGMVGMVGMVGCEDRRDAEYSSEQAFVAKEVKALRDALARRDIPGVVVGCVVATTGLERAPAPLGDEIKQLCFVDAPRLYLEHAVADATRGHAEHPELADLHCTQLFVSDAFETLAAHPTSDPEIRKLIAAYARLCPAVVAKLRRDT
ncbi:MAG: hypothetical protein M3680_12405 [Myxococcota bacterium]|nr:hypothetical protein [Myxococcota bacterium]